jgi:hypothetical protein
MQGLFFLVHRSGTQSLGFGGGKSVIGADGLHDVVAFIPEGPEIRLYDNRDRLLHSKREN